MRCKLETFIEMQRRNGQKISDSKVNTFAARKMVSCLAEAVTNMVKTKIKESTFVSIGCDGSEARKTRDEKELVYCKIVSDGDFGYAMPVFILACKSGTCHKSEDPQVRRPTSPMSISPTAHKSDDPQVR